MISPAGRERAYPPDWPRVEVTKPPRRRTRIILATFGSEMPSARESSGIVRLPPCAARPTRSRHRNPYSSCEESFIAPLPDPPSADRGPSSVASHHPQLELGRLGQHL